jgi:predicted RNase H-like nuclease (RuvC/YqgF family)
MLPLFREASIPLISDVAAGVQVRGKQGLAAKEVLESALLNWQGQQEKHEREKKTELIEHIFKEYKSERGKEVRKGG